MITIEYLYGFATYLVTFYESMRIAMRFVRAFNYALQNKNNPDGGNLWVIFIKNFIKNFLE